MAKVLREIRKEIISLLSDHGINDSIIEADLLIGSVINCDRSYIYSHPEYPVSSFNEKKLDSLVQKRAEKRVPLQYILGNQEFYGYHIEVGYGALVPRPETELLVEKALQKLDNGKFLDWGTGSGAIAVALLNERAQTTGLAIDCSPVALCWAWRNLKRYHLLRRCLLWHSADQGDLPVEDASLQLVVSNPPYIKSGDIKCLMPEVRDHEPRCALDGGKDGTCFYPQLFGISVKKLHSGGSLLIEIGEKEQVDILEKIAPPMLRMESVFEDYGGMPRIMEWTHV